VGLPLHGLTLGAVLLAGFAARAEQPLRYRLEPGDRLVYERRTVFSRGDSNRPPEQRTQQVQIWCLAQEGDAWLVLADIMEAAEGRTSPARGAVLRLNVDGRRRPAEEGLSRLAELDPALDVLPMLPLAGHNAADWLSPPDTFGRRWRCRRAGVDANRGGHSRVDFNVEDPTGVLEMRGDLRRGTIWFDPAAGHVSRLESETLDSGGRARTRTTVVLRRTIQHTPRWAMRRAAEAERYVRALRHEERLLHEVVTRPAEASRTLEQLDRLWSALQSDVEQQTASPFRRLAEGHRETLRAEKKRWRTRATLAEQWVGRAARPWSLQDAADQTLTSEAVRQGVVIECFWSVDSTAGLRAMESWRRLVAACRGSGVPLICYNMDADIRRARVGIERCGRGLRHVLGGPLQAVERVPEFPVVRVLDQTGVVREMWVGWQREYTGACELASKLSREGKN